MALAAAKAVNARWVVLVKLGKTSNLIVLALLAALPLEVEAQADARTSAHLERLVARYDSAWGRRDTLIVSRLLASRYQYFTSRGGVSSRAETMRFLIAPEYRLERARRSELTVTLSGPVAVVSSRWQGQGSYRGKPFVDDQRCGQTWALTGQRWQLLSEHCVQIIPEAAPSG